MYSTSELDELFQILNLIEKDLNLKGLEPHWSNTTVCNHDNPSADSESSTPEDPDVTSNDDDDDLESNEDSVAANESEIIHTSNQFLCILNQMKAYALHNQLSQEAHTNIDNLSSILVQSKV